MVSRDGSSSVPASGALRPASNRRSVVLPEPLRPVTRRKPPRSSSTSTPRSTRRSPNRFSSPRPLITLGPHVSRTKDLGGGAVEAIGVAGRGERGGDLLHLADPAPSLLGGRPLGGGQPLGERRHRVAPLGLQVLLDAVVPRDVAD